MTIFRKKNPNHLQAVAGMHEADDVLDNDNSLTDNILKGEIQK